MPSEPTFTARWGDGVSAASRPAVVSLGADGLELRPDDVAPIVWPYADIRVAEPIRSRSLDATLSLRNDGRSWLYVDDTLLLARLIERAPHTQLRAERWQAARPGLAVGAIALASVIAIWGLDVSPTKTIAGVMPEKARQVLGDAVIRSMPAKRHCTDAAGVAALGVLMTRLMPSGPITSDAIVVLDLAMPDGKPLINAFAVPGNRLVLTRGLIEQAESADEVAAVIGHEAGHAIELHPESSLVRAVGFWALVQMVFTGTPGAVSNTGVLLAQLSFTRAAERAADGHALRLMREAHISPQGMANFFRRMDERAAAVGTRGAGIDMLASHPSNPERIARIMAEPAYAATPALAAADWQALRSICRSTGAGPKPTPEPSAAPGPVATRAAPNPATRDKTASASDVLADRAARPGAQRPDATEAAEVARQVEARLEAARAEQQRAADAAATERANAEAARAAAAATAAAREQADMKAAADRLQAERAAEAARAEAASKAAADAARAENETAAAKKAEIEQAAAALAEKARLAAEAKLKSAIASGAAPGPVLGETAGPTPFDVRVANATKKLAANPSDVAALFERGQAHAGKGDLAAAIGDFTHVLALRPADANTYFWRASVYARLDDADAAVADYGEVIKLQPKNFAAFNNRGSLFKAQKKLDLALRDYSAALVIDPTQAITLTNRALVYREQHNLDQALADLTAAITANPNYVSAYVRRGETYELKSARDRAIADYRTAMRLPERGAGVEAHQTARARLAALGVNL